jgi:capsular polysaccharide transport system permease protein
MAGLAQGGPGLRAGWRVQRRVVGALILREIHIRFGRRNLGYVWLFAEPLMLGLTIAWIHYLSGAVSKTVSVSVFAFFAVGYSMFFMFRAIVSRAAGGLGAGRELLYHRVIAPIDFLYARHALEAAACTVVVTLTCFAVWVTDGRVPADPFPMVVALVLMLWWCHALALLAAAVSQRSEVAERLVHPLIYLHMPISGMFFLVDWLPPSLQGWALLNPMVHIFELLRDGQFGDEVRTTYDLGFVAAAAAVCHLLGLCAVRSVRRHMESE